MKAPFFISRKIISFTAGIFLLAFSLTGCAELDDVINGSAPSSAPVTFDNHGCMVQNGNYFDNYCYAKQYSGKLYYGYDRSVLQAAGWNPDAATPGVIRDFTNGASVLRWQDVGGDGTWFQKDPSTGAINALYNGVWMPLQQYKNTVATNLEIQRIHDESHQRIMDIILAPDCNYSHNGCK